MTPRKPLSPAEVEFSMQMQARHDHPLPLPSSLIQSCVRCRHDRMGGCPRMVSCGGDCHAGQFFEPWEDLP